MTVKRKSRFKVIDFLTLIYVFYMLSGYTSNTSLYIGFGIFVLWAFVAHMRDSWYLARVFKDKKIKYFTFYWLYIGVIGMPLGGFHYTAKQLGAAILLFSPIILLNFYALGEDKDKLGRIVFWVLAAYAIFGIRSLVAYNEGIAARGLAQNSALYGNIAIGGGYSLAYAAAILSVMMVDLRISRLTPHKLRWFLGWLMIIMLGVIVYQTKSTVTFVCWVIGLCICISFRPTASSERTVKMRNTIIRFFILIIVVILGYLASKVFGEWLLKITANGTDTFTERLRSLAEWLASGGDEVSGSYFLDRLSIPLKPIRIFLQNPIFGAAYKYGNNYALSREYGIGQHCEWADALGAYGMVGGIPFLTVYVLSVKETMRSAKGKLSVAWVITLFLMGTFNPFRTFSSQFVLFFMVPAIASLLINKDNGVQRTQL